MITVLSVSTAAGEALPPETPARIVATAIPAASAMREDGDLTEEVWQRAPVISGFKQRDTRDGAPATFETEARVAYDNNAIYVAVQAIDPDAGKIIGLRTRRDEGSPSDWLRVVIDSFHDRRSGYEFAVNPAGVKQDSYWFNDGNKGILGAAKLTGRVGAFSIGALNAVTADEDALIADGPARRRQTVEPSTSYTVIRAKREFANQSSLGFMTTSTNRRLDDFTRFLPGHAFTGGIDVDWRLTPKYSVTGYAVGSSVRGDAAAIASLQESNVHSFQRPDADHVDLDASRTALNGYGGGLSVNKIGGERTRFTSNVGLRSPGYDINEVGFLRRADQRTMSNWFQWRHDRPTRVTRSLRWNLNQWAGWNYDGDRLFSGGNFNAHAVFVNHWSTGFGVNVGAAGFDDRATRGGPGAYHGASKSVWTYANTDSRKRLSFYVNTFHSSLDDGGGFSNVSRA